MANKKFSLSDKKAGWVEQFKPSMLKGTTLNVSIGIEQRYFEAIDKYTRRMIRETKREIMALFDAFGTDGADTFAMDASVASQARILTNALTAKFAKLFASVASPIANKMVDAVDQNSATSLKSSLKTIAGAQTFSTDILNDQLQDTLTATVAENVALIKRVPQKYLDNVQGAVMRSIQTTGGLTSLREELDGYGVTVRNWSKNVAMDQTRKAYNGINLGRMKALGVKKYEWMHSGGSNKPRPYHKNVLNGQICSVDNPPVIDEKTGERGVPGQLPYCRCKMRPIISFDEDDE